MLIRKGREADVLRWEKPLFLDFHIYALPCPAEQFVSHSKINGFPAHQHLSCLIGIKVISSTAQRSNLTSESKACPIQIVLAHLRPDFQARCERIEGNIGI